MSIFTICKSYNKSYFEICKQFFKNIHILLKLFEDRTMLLGLSSENYFKF